MTETLRTAARYASNGRGGQFRIVGTALEPLRIVRVDVDAWAGDRWEKAASGLMECRQATESVVAELAAAWNASA